MQVVRTAEFVFPLLKLPHFALKEVFHQLNLTDLINFSVISKKSKQIITSLVNYKLNLFVCFGTIPAIDLCLDPDIPLYSFKIIGERRERRAFRLVQNTRHICELFKLKVRDLNISSDITIEEATLIANWLKEHQEFTKRITFEGFTTNRDAIFSFVKTCRASTLRLFLRQNHLIEPFDFELNMDCFVATAAFPKVHWITVDQIINSSCIHIFLSEVLFNEKDMNRFLKSWINGGISRLVYFRTHTKRLNREQLIDGIEVEERDVSVVRSYMDEHLKEQAVIKGGIDIKNNEGKIATFKHETENETECSFMMIVWPESL